MNNRATTVRGGASALALATGLAMTPSALAQTVGGNAGNAAPCNQTVAPGDSIAVIACGNNAQATDNGALAIGSNAQAGGTAGYDSATAIGANVSDGTGAHDTVAVQQLNAAVARRPGR